MQPWIQTYTGQIFTPFDPQPEQIEIKDIAHALSQIARYNGHSHDLISVAEHSIVMAENVSHRAAIHALLHDAAEAYIGDFAKPIKDYFPEFERIEYRIMQVIYHALGICPPSSDIITEIKEADCRMLLTERNQFMDTPPKPWDVDGHFEPYGVTMPRYDSEQAETVFLATYEKLRV